MSRDHGGNLDEAIAQFGGKRQDWLDLSTGINPHAYPLGDIDSDLWRELPDYVLSKQVQNAAKRAYQSAFSCVPLSGAQQAIQIYPSIIPQLYHLLF